MSIELLRQFGLLAQGLDEWGDILVIVVMAVLWLVGALAKVLTGKKGAAQQRPTQGPATQPAAQRETWQQRLARKAREIQRAAEGERESVQRPARTQTPRPRPTGKITVRTDQKGDSVMVYQQALRQHEARDAVIAASPQAGRKPPTTREPIDASSVPTTPALGFQPSIVLDYGDPDALKKAILHCEILGKPLALRESSDDAFPF